MFDDLDIFKEDIILPEDVACKLKKYGIYDSIEELVKKNSLIYIDSDDITKVVRNNEIILLADDLVDVNNLNVSYRRYVDAEPTDCVLSIIASKNITLDIVDRLVDSVKRFGKNVNTIFGITIDEEMQNNKVRVIAILTRSEESKDNIVEEKEQEKAPRPKNVLKFATPDERSLFEVTKLMLEKDITSVNALQVETSFGFNKASKVFSDLEDLGIISKRINGKREFLKNDINEIYYIICNQDNSVSDDELKARIYAIGQYILATKDTSINGVVKRFGYTFDESSQYISILEDRKVLSEKNGNTPRKILINNIHELYECVYGNDF